MQFSTIFTILAAAMTASALPRPDGACEADNTPDDTPSVCNASSANVCCNDGSIINCAVTVLGGVCATQAYCCDSTTAQSGLININANCVKVQ